MSSEVVSILMYRSPSPEAPHVIRIRASRRAPRNLQNEFNRKVGERCSDCPLYDLCRPIIVGQTWLSDVSIGGLRTMDASCNQIVSGPISLGSNVIEHDPTPKRRFSLRSRR